MIILVLVVVWIWIFLFGFPGRAHQSGPDDEYEGVTGEDGSSEDDHIDVSREIADYHRELQLKEDKSLVIFVIVIYSPTF